MSSILTGIIIAAIVSIFYYRQQRKPATRLRDGSGYLLRHGLWEVIIAWLVLTTAAVPVALAAYILWNPSVVHDLSRTLTVLLLCGALFTLLAAWCFRSLQKRIRVNDSSVTLLRGRSAVEINWNNVNRVTTDLTGALLICGSNGAQIAVNKLLVGIPTLVSYMRRHLPESMYYNAFISYRPRAHLGPSA